MAGLRTSGNTDRVLRYAVAWIALALFVLSCFAPWVRVTTYANAVEHHGAFEEAFYGGPYLLALAGVAALGLLARRPTLTVVNAVLAVLLTALSASQAPGAMLQFGWMAELTWGAYLAFASSLALAIAARRASRQSRSVPDGMRQLPSASYGQKWRLSTVPSHAIGIRAIRVPVAARRASRQGPRS